MYTLYYSPGAASLAIHWLLAELQVPFELQLVDLTTKAQKTPDYLKLNPAGMVPTLVMDGMPRTETAALLMLLAERHAEAQLAPAPGTPERAAYLQWMITGANTLMPLFRNWFYPDDVAGAAYAEIVKAGTQPRIEAAWDRVDARLQETGGYIAGSRFTAADCLVTMLMRWSRNMPKPATRWPNLVAYAARTTGREAFRAVCEQEGLDTWPPA
ncbi:MAG: glutathione S-transferase [Alphaproteobacteria bacterium]|nr:glutathione S-transferase [Alphaproteobacteria bacterium]